MTILIWVGLAALSGVIGAEAVEWCKPLQRWLISRIVSVQPAERRARYRRELLGELANLPKGPVTRTVFLLPLLAKRRRLATEVSGHRWREPRAEYARNWGAGLLLSAPVSFLIGAGTSTRATTLPELLVLLGLSIMAIGGAAKLQRIRGGRIWVWAGLAQLGLASVLAEPDASSFWFLVAALAGLGGSILGTVVVRLRWVAVLLLSILPATLIVEETASSQRGGWLEVIQSLPDPGAMFTLVINSMCISVLVRSLREALGAAAWRDGNLTFMTRGREMISIWVRDWVEFKGDLQASRVRRRDRPKPSRPGKR